MDSRAAPEGGESPATIRARALCSRQENVPLHAPADVPPLIRDPIDAARAARLYVAEGLTIAEIARRMDYSRKTVRSALGEQGIEVRPPAKPRST